VIPIAKLVEWAEREESPDDTVSRRMTTAEAAEAITSGMREAQKLIEKGVTR